MIFEDSKQLKLDLQSLSNSLIEKKIKIPSQPSLSVLTEDQAMRVILTLSKEKDITPQASLLAITYLLQKGGSTRNCNPNESVTLDNKTITVANLRQALATCQLKNQARRLGRALAPQIIKIAQNYNIPGNLATAISKTQDISESEMIYLSDFLDREETVPLRLREIIQKHFSTRTQNKSKK